MTIGVIGRKVGMTRVFTEEGASLPVTSYQQLHCGQIWQS